MEPDTVVSCYQGCEFCRLRRMEGYVSLAQAAERLKITRAVVWRHIKAGDIAAERVGRIYIVPESEIERYAVERRKPGRPKTKLAP